jgi:primase-polymerase (primpol)-like protein
MAARNGPKFTALWRGDLDGYASASEGDLALCAILAFWTHNDASRIDRLFRASRRMRAKWDERRGDATTYGQCTIARALK